jgi:hypothetical protein
MLGTKSKQKNVKQVKKSVCIAKLDVDFKEESVLGLKCSWKTRPWKYKSVQRSFTREKGESKDRLASISVAKNLEKEGFSGIQTKRVTTKQSTS